MLTKEKMRLLIEDISARVPYGLKVRNTAEGFDGNMFSINCKENFEGAVIGYSHGEDNANVSFSQLEFVKPYLRPMSSMTEDEAEHHYILMNGTALFGEIPTELYRWLNQNKIDYNGLIEKGLAIEAKEDMYF